MEKETRKINGNDVTIIWGDWQRAGDQEQQRYIEGMIINAQPVSLSDAESTGQVKSTSGEIIDVYSDGVPIETHLDGVEVAYQKALSHSLRKI